MIEQLRFYYTHSINDLRANGQRTLFALLAISAGVAAIVSLLTLGVMIDDTLTGSLQESNRSDIRLSVPFDDEGNIDAGLEDGVVAERGAFDQRAITETGLDAIAAWARENYPGEIEITYRQVLTGASGAGVSVPERDTLSPFVQPFIVEAAFYPLYGERLSEDDVPLADLLQGPTDIVLSRNLADDLEAEVGDTARLNGVSEDFTVTGILPTDAEGGFDNILGGILGYYFVDVSALGSFGDDAVAADVVYLRLSDLTNLEAIDEGLQDRFPYLDVRSTEDVRDENADISEIINQLVSMMGLVSLLIGGIGIVNTMNVVVSRRRVEVAVLKTIGLESEQITVLFMVEAFLMGVLGSILGILLGWALTFAIRGVAESFLAQSLAFRITPVPPITGFIVGTLVTTIFGFLPTLAAGQVRPVTVLRPNDSAVTRAGRARTLAALMVVILALSLVAQPMVGGLFASDDEDTATEVSAVTVEEDSSTSFDIATVGGGVSALLGLIAGIAVLAGNMLSDWTGGVFWKRALRWLLFLIILPLIAGAFGMAVPAVLFILGTFVFAGYLYVMLWVVIWIIGIADNPRQYARPRGIGQWLRLVFVIAFLPLIVAIWLLLLVLKAIPGVRIDLTIALRSILAARARAASTMLALVIGLLTLSLITMLTTAVLDEIERLLVDQTGGNVLVFAAGNSLETVEDTLASFEGVESYAVVGTHAIEFVSLEDVSAGATLSREQLIRRVEELDPGGAGPGYADLFDFAFQGLDARELDSNLPSVDFYDGRQLTPEDAGRQVMIMTANEGTIALGFEVGDRVTLEFQNGLLDEEDRLFTLEVVGMLDGRGIAINTGSANYAPIDIFPEDLEPEQLNAVVQVDEARIGDLRRAFDEIPGTFVLETRLLNDLINRLFNQFTAFPILVAGVVVVYRRRGDRQLGRPVDDGAASRNRDYEVGWSAA